MNDPLAIDCPLCKAPAGEKCTDPYGHPREVPHAERKELVRIRETEQESEQESQQDGMSTSDERGKRQ